MPNEEIIKRQLLECTTGTSNKFYEVILVYSGGIYIVRCRYGVRKSGSRKTFPVDKDYWKTRGGRTTDKSIHTNNIAANYAFKSLVFTKKQKGYVETDYPSPKKTKTITTKSEDTNDTSLERFCTLEL